MSKNVGALKIQAILDMKTYEPIRWEDIDYECAVEYVKGYKRVFTHNKTYATVEELLDDIKKAEGIVTLACDETMQFTAFFLDLVRNCIGG